MKIQHYCYTRTNYLDYGDFVLPINLAETELDAIRKKVLSITADVHLQLTTPKWILIKNEDYIVWGCCCWNRLLAKEKFKDYSATPVYGFFSIVISDFSLGDVKIPFDLEYFRMLYSLEVEPFWNRREEHANDTNDYIIGDFNYIRPNRNSSVSLLNTDKFQCQSLCGISKDKLIEAALTLDNVSLLIDNDSIEQATNKKGSFMNCMSSLVSSGTYPVKQCCPQCKQYVSTFTSEGICMDCGKKTKMAELKKNEDEIDKRMKMGAGEGNSKIGYLQYEIEELRQQIKKKDLLIKILLGALLFLLVIILYICRDYYSFNLFEENKTEYSQVKISAPVDLESSHTMFSFNKTEIMVGTDGIDTLELECSAINTNVDFSTNVDWIKFIEKRPHLKIKVDKYFPSERRVAKITAKIGEQSQFITIIQGDK